MFVLGYTAKLIFSHQQYLNSRSCCHPVRVQDGRKMATRVPDPLVTSHRLIWSSARAEGKTKVHVRFVSSKHVTPVWSHLAQTSWLTAVTILTPLHCQPPSGSRWKSDSYSIKLTSSKIIFSDVFKNIIYKNSRKEKGNCCCFVSTEKQSFKRSKLSMSSSPPSS